MNIDKLLEFLQKEENRKFFKELQELKEISINDIQKLISNNPDKPRTKKAVPLNAALNLDSPFAINKIIDATTINQK